MSLLNGLQTDAELLEWSRELAFLFGISENHLLKGCRRCSDRRVCGGYVEVRKEDLLILRRACPSKLRGFF